MMTKLAGRRSGIGIFLLTLLLVAFWFYQQPGEVTADSWSWEEQMAMEAQMQQAALANPGEIPQLDLNIPPTETALFALG